MPKGPQGQKRPADAIGLAVLVGKIATGEIKDIKRPEKEPSVAGQAGGKARALALGPKKKVEIAKAAAKARWSKEKHPQS